MVCRHQPEDAGVPQILAGGRHPLQGVFDRRAGGRLVPAPRRGDHRDRLAGPALRGQLLQERRPGIGHSDDRDRPFRPHGAQRRGRGRGREEQDPRGVGAHPRGRGQRVPHRGAGSRPQVHAARREQPRRAVHRDQGGEHRGHRTAFQRAFLQAGRGKRELRRQHAGRDRIYAAHAVAHRRRARAGGHAQAADRERERPRPPAPPQHDGRTSRRLGRARRVVPDHAPEWRLLGKRHPGAGGPAGRARRRRPAGVAQLRTA